jgi:lipopolysaccharide heptosyltransferase II
MKFNQDSIKNVKNILVVGKNNQVGDMICSLPLYAALEKKFPSAKIKLVAVKTNYPIPLKEMNPYLDSILVYDKSSLKTIYQFYKTLRKIKYQIGIVTSTFAFSTTSHIINFLSGAKIRVGVESIDGRKNKDSKYLNVKKDFYWDKEKKHQKERNLDVVRQIQCDLTEDEIQNIGLAITEDDEKFAKEFFSKNFPDKSRIIIGIHPGAGKVSNIWDTKKFYSAINEIYKKYNCYVLITAGWTDKQIINSIEEKLNESEIDFVIAENFTIKKLAAVLNRINLYITNDTGTMHIAGLTKCPMISLFGATKSYEWAPTGNQKYFIKSTSDNINDISVEEVLSLSNNILKNSNKNTHVSR